MLSPSLRIAEESHLEVAEERACRLRMVNCLTAGALPSALLWRKDAETRQGGEDRKADRSETKTTQEKLAAVSQPETRKCTENKSYYLYGDEACCSKALIIPLGVPERQSAGPESGSF